MPGVWHDCDAETENKEELATPKPTVVTGNNYVMGCMRGTAYLQRSKDGNGANTGTGHAYFA